MTDSKPMPADGWMWFEPSSAVADDETELVRACRTCFSTPAGQRVLDHLRAAFLDRRLGPNASDAELRHVEGQRSVVANLLRLTESFDP